VSALPTRNPGAVRACGACVVQAQGKPPGRQPFAIIYLCALADSETVTLAAMIEELCPEHRKGFESMVRLHRDFLAVEAPS
jgi:hypothetical protein